jgi:hypothetical protein
MATAGHTNAQHLTCAKYYDQLAQSAVPYQARFLQQYFCDLWRLVFGAIHSPLQFTWLLHIAFGCR